MTLTDTETMRANLGMSHSHPVDKQRPKTTASVARRMVSHALGVRIQVSPKQKETEENDLNEAKGIYVYQLPVVKVYYKILAGYPTADFVCSSFQHKRERGILKMNNCHPPPERTD